MKTLKRITLTAILIMTAINISLSNNYKIYQIATPAGKLLEIISTIERPVEETIPGYEFFVAGIEDNYTLETNDIAFYAEPEADDPYEVFTRSSDSKTVCTYESTVEFVKSISKPEEPVEETIPGYEYFVAGIKDNYTLETNDIAFYAEPEADDPYEVFTSSSDSKTVCTYESTVELVKSISKPEEPVEETIPGYEFFVAGIKDNYMLETNDIAFYAEPEADDPYVAFTRHSVYQSDYIYEAIAKYISSIGIAEALFDNFSFDTRVIFEEYWAEKTLTIRNEMKTNIIKPEEIIDIIFLLMDYQNQTNTK